MTYGKIWVIALRTPKQILPLEQYDTSSFRQMIEEVISANQGERKQIFHVPDMAYECGDF